MKKEWYKRWWGVLLAIIFLPLFAFWWVWKKSKFAPKVKKILLIVIGVFDVLIYSSIVYASIVSVGTPVLNSVKSPVNQETISISGYNVASEATVELILNGNESQQAKADSSGKFTFSEVKLNEGENKVKASTVTSEGKTKESAEMKIVYQKPSEAAQATQNTSTPTSTPSTSSETQTPVPQPKSDQDIIKEIVANELSGKNNNNEDKLRSTNVVAQIDGGWGVFVEYNPDEGISNDWTKKGIEVDMAKLYRVIYKNTGKDIRTATIAAYVPMVDKYGNTSDGMAYKTMLDKDVADKVNWSLDDSYLGLSIMPNVWDVTINRF